jgi:phosphoglycolate phosphatase
MTPPAVLLYDWNNTLVDGWAPITAALNAAFTVFEMPRWAAEDARARPPAASR